MITNIIIGPSITIIMKTTTIIESMIERAVHIDIITEDLLHPLEEEGEREVVTGIMISITDQEITTNKSTMKMNTDMAEEKKIQGRVVIIITESIHGLCLILDHSLDSLNLTQIITVSLEEKR
jgi:hypothetical protein